MPDPIGNAQAYLAAQRMPMYNYLMNNPGVFNNFMSLANAEVGGQGPEAMQAFMESQFNRANMGFEAFPNQGYNFFNQLQTPSGTHSEFARGNGFGGVAQNNFRQPNQQQMGALQEAMHNAVFGGSNISNYATGNASTDKHGRVVSPDFRTNYGGERFGQEQWFPQSQYQAQQANMQAFGQTAGFSGPPNGPLGAGNIPLPMARPAGIPSGGAPMPPMSQGGNMAFGGPPPMPGLGTPMHGNIPLPMPRPPGAPPPGGNMAFGGPPPTPPAGLSPQATHGSVNWADFPNPGMTASAGTGPGGWMTPVGGAGPTNAAPGGWMAPMAGGLGDMGGMGGGMAAPDFGGMGFGGGMAI